MATAWYSNCGDWVSWSYDPLTNAEKIEITPAMIDAGAEVYAFCDFKTDWLLEDIVAIVFGVMSDVRSGTLSSDQVRGLARSDKGVSFLKRYLSVDPDL